MTKPRARVRTQTGLHDPVQGSIGPSAVDPSRTSRPASASSADEPLCSATRQGRGLEALCDPPTTEAKLRHRNRKVDRLVDDVALVSNTATLTGVGPDPVVSTTTEIFRRQPDGGWAHVVDDPFFIRDAPRARRPPRPDTGARGERCPVAHHGRPGRTAAQGLAWLWWARALRHHWLGDCPYSARKA